MKFIHIFLMILFVFLTSLSAALADPDCSEGVRCKSAGECFYVKDQGCRPGSDRDCKQSEICKKNGACSFKHGSCVAMKDEDCKNSTICEEMGMCSLRGLNCVPVLTSDCQRSMTCKVNGNCVLYERKPSANLPSFNSCVRNKKFAESQEDEKSCTSVGGRWLGNTTGRGRMTGCLVPTSDKGKSCNDSRECESVCVNHKCHEWSNYRGCGIIVEGKVTCID